MNEPDLHVFEAGAGEAVVLLHGLPSPAADLEALAPDLVGRWVLVPHLPGYGTTPHAPGSQGVEAVEAALIEALTVRKVERPVLVGFGMGAYRALSLALALDARAVVCLGGFADLSAEERARFTGFADALRAGVDLRGAAAPRLLSTKHRAARPADDAVVEAWLDLAESEVLIEELEDAATAPSLLKRIAALDCPIVARTGAEDAAFPPEHARALVEASRHGTLEIAPGVGHALLLEDRAATVATLRRACNL